MPDLSKYNFKPGQSGNPEGRPRIPENLRSVRPLSHDEMIRIVSKLLRMNVCDLESIKIENVSSIEAMIITVIIKAIQNGDTNKIEFLLNRCGLKIKDIVEIQSSKFDERLDSVPADKIVEAIKNYKRIV